MRIKHDVSEQHDIASRLVRLKINHDKEVEDFAQEPGVGKPIFEEVNRQLGQELGQ